MAGGGAWLGGHMCPRGASVPGGMHGGGGWGACVVGGGGVCGRGGMCGRGACMAGETATAADGTHPTGMHSCYQLIM